MQEPIDRPAETPQDAPRRRQRRKADRPGEILSAAQALWAERGFAASRAEDIAARAGVAKGTVFRYFPTKEAIFEAAVQARLASALERVEGAVLDPGASTEALLRGFFDEVLERIYSDGLLTLLRVLLAEGARFPDLVQAYRRGVVDRGMAALQGVLARGVARGELRAEAAALDPRLVIAPAVLTAVWQMLFGGLEKAQARALLAAQVDLLLRGLAPLPGGPAA
jgi:TetR/AcrR family transcriptional regulator